MKVSDLERAAAEDAGATTPLDKAIRRAIAPIIEGKGLLVVHQAWREVGDTAKAIEWPWARAAALYPPRHREYVPRPFDWERDA